MMVNLGPVSERVVIASCTQFAIELRWIAIIRLIANLYETGPRCHMYIPYHQILGVKSHFFIFGVPNMPKIQTMFFFLQECHGNA